MAEGHEWTLVCPNCGNKRGNGGLDLVCGQGVCPIKSFLPHSPGAGYGCVKQGDSRRQTEKEGGRVVEGEGSGLRGERSEGAHLVDTFTLSVD